MKIGAPGCRKRRRPQKSAKQSQKKTNCNPPKFNQLKAKAIYKKTSDFSEVFELFALSSSVVPLYADELEMTKSASFSTALTSLSILYRQAENSPNGEFFILKRGSEIVVGDAAHILFMTDGASEVRRIIGIHGVYLVYHLIPFG